MDDVGIFFEGDVIPNREHMTTRAARTGGPGGLCFSAGLGVGSRLLSKEERRSPPLPYPTAFQPAWRTTWASIVGAVWSGATKRREVTKAATGLVGEHRPTPGGINGAVGRGRGTGLSCPGAARPAATAYGENA